MLTWRLPLDRKAGIGRVWINPPIINTPTHIPSAGLRAHHHLPRRPPRPDHLHQVRGDHALPWTAEATGP